MKDDLISRQAAIDDIRKCRFVVDAIEKIRGLTPAQPEPQWVPCSERLPDDLAEVNITWVNTDPEPYYEFLKGKPNTGSAVYYRGKWYWSSVVCQDYLAEYGNSPGDEMDDAIRVVAWMPLPEPYKDVDDE